MSSARSVALVALLAAGLGVLVVRRRFAVVTVTGDSMLPTLRPGDRVLVRRVPLRRVHRGQLVVFARPSAVPPLPDDPPWLVKRAVALPGDSLPRPLEHLRGDDGARVPAGTFAVLGDNRGRSYDSRRAGFLPAEDLLGVVLRTLS